MQTAEQEIQLNFVGKFRSDFSEGWQRLPNKGFFLVLFAAWIALFHFLGNSILGYIHSPSLFLLLYNSYTDFNSDWVNILFKNPFAAFGKLLGGDNAFGFLIPPLVLVLLWWKRKELLKLPLRIWRPALFLFVLAVALHILGYLLQQPRVSAAAFFFGIYGLTGLSWGPEWLKKSFFPFFLFIFSIPFGAQAEVITIPLRHLVSWLVEGIVHLVLGIDVIRRGTQMFDPAGQYQYEIAAACSGIRSLIAISLLATVYGFVAFRSPWKRLLMMAMAIPFAVIGNLLRMLFIIIAADVGGQKAGDYVHEGGPFGILNLVPYVPVVIGLALMGKYFREEKPPDPVHAQ